MIKFPEFGKTIGPPQLKEYPVDPVGVETIRPSAQYVFKYSPSINAFIVIIDDVSFLCNVKSFNAYGNSLNNPGSAFKVNKALF